MRRHSSTGAGAVEEVVSAPVVPIGEIGRAYMCTTRWQAARRALCKCKMQVDKMNLESLVYFYGTGSALRPVLRCRPSLIGGRDEVYIPANECHVKTPEVQPPIS